MSGDGDINRRGRCLRLRAGLTLVVFFAHVAMRPLSAWIERVAPPEDEGPR